MAPGEHLCLIYDADRAGQWPVLLPFVREGLERKERGIYVAADQPVQDVADALH